MKELPNTHATHAVAAELNESLAFACAVQKILPVDAVADRRLAKAIRKRPSDYVPRKLSKK